MNIEAYFKITYGLYVVSSSDGNKLNGYISNTVFQVTADPAQFAIACSKNNFTTGIISKSRTFAISALKKDASAELIGIFGYKSGNDIDKFSRCNYKTGLTGAPVLLDDTIAWFECEVVHSLDVGSHILFIGKVIDGELLDPTGEPLTYAWYRESRNGKAPKNAPTYIDPEKLSDKLQKPLTSSFYKYECTVCGHIYDEELGEPEAGIAPGTRFENLPADWTCPVCGAEKADFIKLGN
jgi:flavin reductase (DIM6/NTAB) family NADH-FMN oxidoreductase RutF/rubredoxin